MSKPNPLEIVLAGLHLPEDADFDPNAFGFGLRPELQRTMLEFSGADWQALSVLSKTQDRTWLLKLCQTLSPVKHGRVATDLLLAIIESDPATYLMPNAERLVAQQALTETERRHLIILLETLPIDPSAKYQTAYRNQLVQLLAAEQTSPPITEASEYSIYNKDALAGSERAACYECLTVFKASEITEFVDNEKTALCPHCGIDTVLPESAGYSFSAASLEALNEYWFG